MPALVLLASGPSSSRSPTPEFGDGLPAIADLEALMSKTALARPSMPAMIVPSTCAACGKAGKFIEFKAEPCTPGSEGERRYGFRCLACKAIVPELVAADGRKHFWNDGQHLEA